MRSQARRLFLFGILSFGVMGATEAFPQSLLNGATASSYTVPSGWTSVWAQGCEGSINTAKEFVTACTSTHPHSGAKSIEGTISYSAASVRWKGFGSALGVGREVYLSWWDYLESQGRMNTEMYVAHFIKQNMPQGPLGYNFEEVVIDWFNDPTGLFNSTIGQIMAVSQGGYVSKANYGPAPALPWGLWTQWEVHFRSNTPGASDGFVRIYKNGILFYALSNTNWNGTGDMSGMDVQVGGTYTKAIWRKAGGACGAFQGDGTETAHCTDFNNCECPPNPPIFKRFLDDIIVMIPGSGGGSAVKDIPAGPPSAPFGLTFQ